MDRREFIRLALAAGVSLGLAGCTPKPQAAISEKGGGDPAQGTTTPGSATTSNAGQDKAGASATRTPLSLNGLVVANGSEPSDLLEKGFSALGGIESLVKKGDIVVIKPNFSVPRAPEIAATTNIFLVSALVKMCLQSGAKEVRVIDNPFTNGEMCLETTGIRREVSAAGGKIYATTKLNDRYYSPVTLSGPILTSVQFSRDVLEADVFINFPILKHHNSTKLTMSLKNMMGLVWDRGVFHRTNLHQAIAELNAFKKPHLIIMDATRGISENGPMGPGNIKECNQLVFGVDPVAVDAYGAELFGMRPSDIECLRIAAGMGLGQINTDNLQITKV